MGNVFDEIARLKWCAERKYFITKEELDRLEEILVEAIEEDRPKSEEDL